MEKRRKITLIVGLAAFLAALLAFTVVYHLPKSIQWSGTAVSWVNEDHVESEITLDLKEWRRLFKEPYFTGALTIDGARYEDIHSQKWVQSEPFIPKSLKDNIGGHQLDIYNDWVELHWEKYGKNTLTVYQRTGGGKTQDPIGMLVRIYDIDVK